MGRLEEPQILLDMLWLALDVSFVAGAGWIPQQLCSTCQDGTGGAGMAGRTGGQSCLGGSWKAKETPAGSGASQVRAELLPGEGLSGLQQGVKFTLGAGQDQGRAVG